MSVYARRRAVAVLAAASLLAAVLALSDCGDGGSPSRPSVASSAASGAASRAGGGSVEVPVPGRVPAPLSRTNVYAADRPGLLSPTVRHDPALVYVPNTRSNTVDVISQRTFKVIDHFAVGTLPQHVVPSWDLRTLYVTNDLSNSLTPIDPRTGRAGRPVAVLDPYNLYFTPNGRWAIVVAEADRQLDFRNSHTMALHHALLTPQCDGIDHMDYTAGGRYALVSCEFSGNAIVVDLRRERVVKTVALAPGAKPQDVKLSPDGRTFYIADMSLDGVWLIDAHTLARDPLRADGRRRAWALPEPQRAGSSTCPTAWTARSA